MAQAPGPSTGPSTGPGPGPGLTIVLLGNTGVGKSASGNTILGRAAFESKKSFGSVTTQISKQCGTVFGNQVSVMDTPGIFGHEAEMQTWCQELLQSNRPCLFLVVVKIDRFTIEQKNAVDAALRVVGDQSFNNCYLLFTGGDELNNMSLDDFINEVPDGPLPPLVERFAGRHHVFNNDNGGQEQVRELLVKSGHLTDAAGSVESEETRIVLIGLPGHGKSASGNTILGSERFKSAAGFQPVTIESVSKLAKVEGRWIKVVDTPGITAKVLSPRKLFEEIMKSVVKAYPGPHVFIIVVKIDRISEADIKLFKMLPKLFSGDAHKYTMVLFTHGDKLSQESIKDLIQRDQVMSRLVSRSDGRYSVFDNTKIGNREQVRVLLEKIEKMVTDNGEIPYTSEMFKGDQPISVKISIKWKSLREWFIKKIRKLDKHHSGYTELNNM